MRSRQGFLKEDSIPYCTPPDSPSGASVRLCECSGGCFEVLRLSPDLTCARRLRELGIFEGASLRLLKRSDPILVLAQDCRIALDLETAGGIEVRAAENL